MYLIFGVILMLIKFIYASDHVLYFILSFFFFDKVLHFEFFIEILIFLSFIMVL
jgi:hypothetical protein